MLRMLLKKILDPSHLLPAPLLCDVPGVETVAPLELDLLSVAGCVDDTVDEVSTAGCSNAE